MGIKLFFPLIFTAFSETRSTLLCLLIMLMGIQSNAQTKIYHPFPDTNSVWSTAYYYRSQEGPGPGPCYDALVHFSRSYIQSGDTTINNIPYNKLYLNEQRWISWVMPPCGFNTFPGTITTGIFKGGLRNDIPNKKVYYYDATQKKECLLYDFGLKIKDTAWNCGKVNTMGGLYVIITSIDSVLIGNKYHKKFNYDGTSTSTIVEGVGGLTGLLEPRAFFEDGGSLTCFSVLGQPLYHYNSAPDCGVVGINETLASNGFEIYPNPSRGIFMIESSQKISSIEVLNVTGELVFSVSGNHIRETINLSSQPAGMYFFKLRTEQDIATKKVIIQH